MSYIFFCWCWTSIIIIGWTTYCSHHTSCVPITDTIERFGWGHSLNFDIYSGETDKNHISIKFSLLMWLTCMKRQKESRRDHRWRSRLKEVYRSGVSEFVFTRNVWEWESQDFFFCLVNFFLIQIHVAVNWVIKTSDLTLTSVVGSPLKSTVRFLVW